MINSTKAFVKKVINSLSKRKTINYRNGGIINFIDVGAIGSLPEPWINNAFYIKNLLRFEPNEPKATSSKNIVSYNYAISSKNEIRKFHIYAGNEGHGSSFYEQNFDYVDANWEKLKNIGPPDYANTWHERSKLKKTIEIECKTLDFVLNDLNREYDFLKADVQGAEYEILLGADKFLASTCLGMFLELLNVPMYKGIKLNDEVQKYLAEKGFYLAKKFPDAGTFNCSNDYLFLRSDGDKINPEKMRIIKKVYGLS